MMRRCTRDDAGHLRLVPVGEITPEERVRLEHHGAGALVLVRELERLRTPEPGRGRVLINPEIER